MSYIWIGLLLTSVVSGLYWLLRPKPLTVDVQQAHRLKTLRQLMWLFQTHRGKSIAWLSGDTQVFAELTEIAHRIQKAINDYRSTEQSSSYWLSTVKLWQQISEQWRNNTVEVNFKQHNALIRQLMYTIEDELSLALLTQRNENSNAASQSGGNLLYVIEFLGQTRAIGTNVTSSGRCESITKIRLCYLSQKLSESVSLLERLDTGFKHQARLIPPILQCVQEHLLPAQNLMSTQEWFSLCTESIDALYRYFDQTILSHNGRATSESV
ncbi:nitrate- and nitrite sensing domain-containing protein [Planctobacterium marinum]|uniref:nitrate- and nitrite sensing domain-containing protein n=1 Tax=Planctobacterium marinum TaxID=1631968 RepID=UPI001E62FE18|nr:nitrate- and nitrite sensing domain-containing protein [Planctobacterium marinum]MCC2604520.1 nitrate- and nitrite sensing domain-containing protein [Planctobacterium marinum]